MPSPTVRQSFSGGTGPPRFPAVIRDIRRRQARGAVGLVDLSVQALRHRLPRHIETRDARSLLGSHCARLVGHGRRSGLFRRSWPPRCRARRATLARPPSSFRCNWSPCHTGFVPFAAETLVVLAELAAFVLEPGAIRVAPVTEQGRRRPRRETATLSPRGPDGRRGVGAARLHVHRPAGS